MARNQNKTSPSRILAVERMRRALELRKFGLSFVQIAEELGYASPETARNAVKRALEMVPAEDASELRQINHQRLESFVLALWPKTQTGDVSAINTALNVMDKIDKLFGTEAAQQHNVDVTVGGVLQIGVDRDQYINGLKRVAGIVDADNADLESLIPPDAIDVSTTPVEIPEKAASTVSLPEPPTNGKHGTEIHTAPINAFEEAEADETAAWVCRRYVKRPDGINTCARCGHERKEHQG